MSSLSNIRSRLRAVENIGKIATSMEMVASARFRRAHDKAKQSQFYIHKMEELLQKLSSAATDEDHPLFIQRPIKKIGLVVVTSDRGLCGAYNTNIFSAAEKFLKDKKSETIELILLGRKAIHYYQRKQWKVRETLTDWGKKSYSQVAALRDHLINAFLSKEIDVVWLLYTKFYNLMQREVVLEKFLPIGKSEVKAKGAGNYIFEPSMGELYFEILNRYSLAKIESTLDEAYASELAARIFSMKAAAKNAEEMFAALTLERNKIRQSGITREILETTSAMEN